MAMQHLSKVSKAGKVLTDLMKESDWKENEVYHSKAKDAINALIGVDMTMDLLRTTGIGKTVKAFSKHLDPIIGGYCVQLVKKWKELAGVKVKPNVAEKKLLAAREKLRNNYKAANDTKNARTLVVIKTPVNVKRKKSSTISVGGAATRFRGHRARSTSPPMTIRRPNVRRQPVMRRKDDLDAHLRKQTLLRARANKTATDIGRQTPTSISRSSKSTGVGLPKEYLAQKYPRIRNAPVAEPKRGVKKLSSAEQQVVEWFRGLVVDMSQYANQFIAQGFDSMIILKTMKPEDVDEIVEKKAHARIIKEAVSLMQRPANGRSSLKRRRKTLSDGDEDYEKDGFVVDDDDVYQPGMVQNMMQKRYGGREQAYSEDSSDMEASYEEIQDEEVHTERFGAFEDDREDRRNKYLERIEKRKKKKI